MTVQEIIWIASLTTAFAGGIDWLLRLWFEHRAKMRLQSSELAATLMEERAKTITKLQGDLKERTQQFGQLQTAHNQLKAAGSKLLAQYRSLHQQLDQQQRDAQTFRQERDKLRIDAENLQQDVERLKHQAAELERQLEERVDVLNEEVQARDDRIRELTGDRDQERERAREANDNVDRLTEELQQLNNQLAQMNKQIEGVIKQDERVWERPLAEACFQPLSERKVPIIAVLNLKGGVGKTTITANLAGLMAQKQKKVLVIDADYQRNLSMLLVTDKDRKMLHLERRTLQHFLIGQIDLFEAASKVSSLPGCWVVTNSDALTDSHASKNSSLEDIGLEDIEMRLMAEWMFHPNSDDVRLRLCKAMQPRLKEKDYQYVLIDCPPRLSTACINALAASDFFLVPVLLDATSARSVSNLLRTVLRLRGCFPGLKCLGIVANGVEFRSGKLIKQQEDIRTELVKASRISWESDVYPLQTKIPASNYIARAAGHISSQGEGPCLALGAPDIKKVFANLLHEIEKRVAHESPSLAAVSS
jgi:cellulose biosynthesis protein BcsQ